MTLSVFITVISDHDKPQPPGCLLEAGVDAGEFDAARNSFMVKTLTARQESAAEEFALTGTPSFYINGKYQIKNSGIKDGSTEGYGKEFADIVRQLMITNP